MQKFGKLIPGSIVRFKNEIQMRLSESDTHLFTCVKKDDLGLVCEYTPDDFCRNSSIQRVSIVFFIDGGNTTMKTYNYNIDELFELVS